MEKGTRLWKGKPLLMIFKKEKTQARYTYNDNYIV
jgi:hypothetical protein